MALDAAQLRERRLEAARGYLMLDMPDHALKELRAIDAPHECRFEIAGLRGEALRQNGRFDEALQEFLVADDANPDDLAILFGQAWCLKRTERLHDAIAAMERAYEIAPDEAVVLYNLACYWTLAGDKQNALSWLGRALRMDAGLQKLIPEESDFDALRDDPDFQFIIETVAESRRASSC